MYKIRKRKPRNMLLAYDQSPAPNDIARSKGTTVAIEATSESLQASENSQTPSLFEMIKQRNEENKELRKALARQQAKQGDELYLLEGVRLVMEKLQQALVEYHKLQSAMDDEPGADR